MQPEKTLLESFPLKEPIGSGREKYELKEEVINQKRQNLKSK